MIFCLNGKFVDQKDAKISVLDNGFQFGDGFYDTMRTYKGLVFELDIHLKRVEKTAKALGIKMPWALKQLGQWAQKVITVNKLENARLRITISRGENGFDFISSKNPTLAITCEPLIKDPKAAKGVSVFTIKVQRVWPEIKTLGLTAMILAYRTIFAKNGYEAIMIDGQGYVREGASTNVFIVKNGVLMTPKTKILPGATRNRVIALAKKIKLKLRVEDFKVSQLANSDEIFLTNRPREIIPVVKLNGKRVGSGEVGPFTKKMIQAYHEYVEEYLALYSSNPSR